MQDNIVVDLLHYRLMKKGNDIMAEPVSPLDRRILTTWDSIDLANPDLRAADVMSLVELAIGASAEEQRAALRRDQLRRRAGRNLQTG